MSNGKMAKNAETGEVSRGQCCDHNFLRFSPIFAEQIGVFKPM
jgi:hypothetical protein